MTSANLIRREGRGRAFLVLREAGLYSGLADVICAALLENSTTMLVECEQVNEADWQEISREVISVAAKEGLKQVSLVACGPATVIAQNICLVQPRFVRSLVLFDIDAQTQSGPLSGLVDWLERKLPMGLPFRSRIRGFDGRPFLQRLRCPALVVSTPLASQQAVSQARLTAERIPTCWFYDLSQRASDWLLAAGQLLAQFEKIPARCPQRGY